MTEPLRLLCLGDSYTIGEGVPADARWPSQLAARLGETGVSVAPPEVIARTGWTTDELEAGIAEAAPHGPYALVTLMIGVNDQYRGRPLGEYRRHFRALLASAVRFAGGSRDRVIVISIPDWGVTSFAANRDPGRIAAEIDRRNALAAELAGQRHVAFVDVTAISRELGGGPGALASDGLHPSAAQHARWAEAILPAARRALAR